MVERGRGDPKHTTIPLYGYRSVGLGTFEEERAVHETEQRTGYEKQDSCERSIPMCKHLPIKVYYK